VDGGGPDERPERVEVEVLVEQGLVEPVDDVGGAVDGEAQDLDGRGRVATAGRRRR